MLREALDHSGDGFTGWPQAEAANLAAQPGGSARELSPALDRLLDDPIACPATVRALIALDPEANITRRAFTQQGEHVGSGPQPELVDRTRRATGE